MRFYLLTFLLLATTSLFAQLTVTVTSIPSNTPENDDIYIAGNFQSWNPGDENYKLEELGNNQFQITFSPTPGLLEFKFTRGSWPTVEGTANGGLIANRTFTYDGSATNLDLSIAGWEGLSGGGTSTAADNVYLLDDDFFIPQLDTDRRIWIYLPPDYETSSKHYPVLYMHDGQNLFDVQTSFTGEWKVDESLNMLFDQGDYGAIVIGIDNGGASRLDEYSPWYNEDYEDGGEGEDYIEFIAETLKPHIDANYRTLTEPEFTVLFGSSLGGLISQYGLMERQDVFGKAGVFSPAFWFNPEIFDHSENTDKIGAKKVYMLAGTPEGNGSVVENVNQMEAALSNNGFTNNEFSKAFHTDGAHSEWYWAREFPWAYLWLFDGASIVKASEAAAKKVSIYPNPADSVIYFKNLPNLKRPVVRITSMDGTRVYRKRLEGNQVDVSQLASGVYVMEVRARKGFLFSQKIVVRSVQ